VQVQPTEAGERWTCNRVKIRPGLAVGKVQPAQVCEAWRSERLLGGHAEARQVERDAPCATLGAQRFADSSRIAPVISITCLLVAVILVRAAKSDPNAGRRPRVSVEARSMKSMRRIQLSPQTATERMRFTKPKRIKVREELHPKLLLTFQQAVPAAGTVNHVASRHWTRMNSARSSSPFSCSQSA